MDRVRVQVQFKKMLWTCPKCKQEDWEDRPMGGGADYTHTCSACSHFFNQTNSKEYNGTVNYTPEEYEKVVETDVSKAKQDLADAWLVGVKNPPAYVEPSKEDYLRMYQDEITKAQETLDLYASKATAEELTIVKSELEAKVASIDSVVSEKVVSEKIVEEPIEEIKG